MFYQKDSDYIIKEFSSSRENGLSQAEVENRILKYGKNEIKKEKKESVFLRFLASFGDIFALLLIGAAFISFFLGGPTGPRDAFVILVIIVLNSTIGFIQEYKAERIVDALNKVLPKKAVVLRDGKEVEILSEDIVPGDIIVLDEGDDIPADGRIIEASNFSTNDFTLTGESVPQHKFCETIPQKVALTDIDNMVFAGTSVAIGVARVIVVATGQETEFGKIAKQTQNIVDDPSPLQKELARSAQTVSKITLLIGVLIFVLNILLGKPFSSSLIFALSLAVAMVPEGLPTTVSIALALAVKKMAQKNALVKKLSAVETLGSATVICTDKTGTVTKNEMTVKEAWVNNKNYHVKGVGYSPEGDFLLNNKKSKFSDVENVDMCKAAIFCNNAQLIEPQGDKNLWSIVGDPTEGALLTFSQKAGLNKKTEIKKARKILEIPFSSETKKMTVVYDFGKDIISYTKGAPSEVLKICNSISVNGLNKKIDSYKKEIENKVDEFAKQGLRVLAFAKKDFSSKKEVSNKLAESNLTFLGLVGMIDPPKDGVEEAVKIAKNAGIKIFMITGDYGLTAATIAERVGIVDKNYAILTGLDLLKMKDNEISKLLKTQDVIFSRTAPDQKIRIVNLLQQQGEVVAVTGDGVNDAPALRKADIGVAMGIAGTDVSKEASDIILLDDNFKTIVFAIREGRTVYANLKKFVHYIFSSNVGELFAVITGLIAGIPVMTIAAIQILAVDLGTDVLPSLALANDPEPEGIMNRKPRDQKERLLNKKTISDFFFIGVIMGVFATFAFTFYLLSNGWSWGKEVDAGLYIAASTVTYASLVFSQIANVLSTHAGRKPFISQLLTNRSLILACLSSIFILNIFMFTPVIKDFLEMEFPGYLGIVLAITVGIIGFTAIKIKNSFGSYIAE